MAEHKVTHVVVVEDDYPVGVVSALDVAGAAGGA
jgi:CBS domain-containing protein